MPPDDPEHRRDRVIVLFLFGLLVFTSPMRDWWASTHSLWFAPYALWALIIALVAWQQGSVRRHDL